MRSGAQNPLLLAALAAALAACGKGSPLAPENPKDRAVKDAVSWAAKTINRTKHDTASLLSYAATVEQGGDPVTYLAANMPDGAAFTCYAYRVPPKPDCVVIKDGPGEGQYTIEGWGAALDKPVASEIAEVGKPRRGSN